MEGNHSQVESTLVSTTMDLDLTTDSCICSHELPPIATTDAAATFHGWFMFIIIHAEDDSYNGVSIHHHAA